MDQLIRTCDAGRPEAEIIPRAIHDPLNGRIQEIDLDRVVFDPEYRRWAIELLNTPSRARSTRKGRTRSLRGRAEGRAAATKA